jgi:ribonuclease HI
VPGVTRVADLFSPDGRTWDVAKVDAMFTRGDDVDIKQIAIGGPGVADYMAWNFTKNGCFTVKSAYHLKMSLERMKTGQPESSSSVNKHRGFMALWDTCAPPKAKIHMWRLIKNGLAVGYELHRRRIKPGVFCVACGREETIYHRFWACQHSVRFWQLLHSEKGVSVAIPPSMIGSQSALARWLLDWFAGASDSEREAMIQATYGLWLARNEARDGRRIAPPHEIMHSVDTYMQEWRAVHAVVPRMTATRELQRWEPPDAGWIKVNSDGAVSKHGDKGGGGAVLRDQNGAFRAAVCHHFPNIVDPEAAEILACRRGLEVAASLNVSRVHVELDSQGVVQMLKQPTRNLSAVGPWVHEVKVLLALFDDFKISWVRRSANVAAHKLAKVGVGDEICNVWLGVPPDFVLDVISDDIPTFEG